MAKKAKAAAATKRIKAADPGKVKSAPPVERRTLTIDKLGKVIKWDVPDAPYRGEENLRIAFVGGFEARVQQVNSAMTPAEYHVPERFNKDTDSQRAFADGYNAAASQDQQSAKPASLAGSSSKAGKRR